MVAEFAHSPPGSAGPAGPQSSAAPPPEPSPAQPDKVISDAVKLAYGVVNEQIAQGQRAAERVREGSYNAADLERDIKGQIDRVLRLSKDLGVASFDVLTALVRASASGVSIEPEPAPTNLAVEVKSSKRAQVTIDLRAKTERFVPTVPPLHAADRSVEPLKNVRIVTKDAATPVLVVEIPDDQPIGVYTGAVVDATSHEPGGFICVRVLS